MTKLRMRKGTGSFVLKERWNRIRSPNAPVGEWGKRHEGQKGGEKGRGLEKRKRKNCTQPIRK
jgi:hypothetical protein